VSARNENPASGDGGARRATIADVARVAGVSTATVSRVLSGASRVSPAKDAQVRAAIEALDYNPSDLTRAIFSGRANSVGVLVSDLRNPYYVDLMRGIESVLGPAGALVFLASGARDHEQERRILRSMDSQRVRGLVATVTGRQDETIRTMADRGTECVFMTRPAGVAHRRVHSVRVDDSAVGALAWRRLRDSGRRSFIVVTQSSTQYTQRSRLRGFRDAAAADGFDLPDERVVEVGSLDHPTGRLAEVLVKHRVDGVFAATGIASLRAYQQVAALGITMPDDLAFVGFDDFPWAPYVAAPLTLIAQPALEMGMRAAQLILDEPGRSQEVVMAPHLVERASG
jgi:LacI family transcriptional regulator